MQEDLGDPEESHRHRHEIDPTLKLHDPKREPELPRHRVDAHAAQRETLATMRQSLDDRAAGQESGQEQPEEREGKYSGGPNFSAKVGQRMRQKGEPRDANGAGDERADGGDRQAPRRRAPVLAI